MIYGGITSEIKHRGYFLLIFNLTGIALIWWMEPDKRIVAVYEPQSSY